MKQQQTQTLTMAFSTDEMLPPHLCMPEIQTVGMCGDVATTPVRDSGQRHDFTERESPKSISLTHDHEMHQFAVTTSGSVEVEITPHLAARFDEYEHSSRISVDSEAHSSDFGVARRRSLTQTATFPSHLPFPSMDSPQRRKTKHLTPAIEPRTNADRAQWLMESLQKTDAVSEQKRMNQAASVGIESILSAMRQHRDNDRVQRYGCGALQKLACQGDTNRALIAESGGVVDILTAMKLHPERASIQERGCLVLSSLSKVGNGNALIVEKKGVETILRAMKAHVANEAVQKHGCLVLLGLACSSIANNSEIARLGGIDVIMHAMACHRGSSGVREYGSAALWSLAYMNAQNRAAIEEVGGVDTIFHALNHTDKEQVPCLSQEDQCMQVINQQRNQDTEDLDQDRIGRQGVDAILSVFVRPLEQ